ncbi:PA2779 family protein [Nitrosophilus kaiyonis]|uniref:PA2779 family protein n=1 Tax=Nitrosophilus kaiyonis TaxID=2930200 RepID=UPI002492BDAF|nr:PA2779 family protein [Nitrosophilus kaiyonis]
MKSKFSKIVLSAMIGLSIFTNTTYASFVSTQAVVEKNLFNIEQKREKIKAFMQRKDVIKKFEAMGIDPKDAQKRVASLSDEEIEKISKNIDNMPAGGNAIIGAIVLIFLVLLITDILGYTKVFTFTKPIQ